MTAIDFLSSRRDAGTGFGPRKRTLHTFSGTSLSSVFFLFKSVLGMMFFMAAIGLWVLPGALRAPELQSMQLLVTALFGGLGFVLFLGNPPGQKPEVHIDLARRTVGLSIHDITGQSVPIATYMLDELSDLTVLGTTVVATDLAGHRVINLDLADQKVAKELRDFLYDIPLLSRSANLFSEPDAAV